MFTMKLSDSASSKLEGKCALVTGSSSGIGAEIARRLAQKGADVVVNYFKSQIAAEEVARGIRGAGGRVITVRCDVSKASDVDQMITKTIAEFGRLDILVNNAGIAEERGGLLTVTEEIWDKIIDINLKGAFLVSRRAMPEILKQGRGKIINIASINSFVAEPNSLAYCSSKAGLIGLTKSLALEFAPKGINVNAIAPGQIETPLMAEWLSIPEVTEALKFKTPYGRVGKPTDVASLAAFLADDESEFVNGAVFVVDGGWMIQ